MAALDHRDRRDHLEMTEILGSKACKETRDCQVPREHLDQKGTRDLVEDLERQDHLGHKDHEVKEAQQGNKVGRVHLDQRGLKVKLGSPGVRERPDFRVHKAHQESQVRQAGLGSQVKPEFQESRVHQEIGVKEGTQERVECRDSVEPPEKGVRREDPESPGHRVPAVPQGQ